MQICITVSVLLLASHVSNGAVLEGRGRTQLRATSHNWHDFSKSSSVPQQDHSCRSHDDCGWHARCDPDIKECASLPIGADPRADIIMGVLGFLIAAISLAAGVGGGGLNVPILMLVISFDAHVATAMSQAMLTGGALAAFIYNYTGSHPTHPKRPLINFELASLIGAGVVSGAQVGSVIHAMAPSAVILFVLCAVLVHAATKGVSNALKISQKESAADAKGKAEPDSAPLDSEDDPHAGTVWERSVLAQRNLGLFWILVIGLIVVKNVSFSICSPMWWAMTAAAILILGGLTLKIAKDLSEQEPVDEHDLDFTELAFPLAAYCVLAGCLAALCGIGGGMVVGPILTAPDPKHPERPMVPPPIAAATTATTLLVLASSTCLVYACRGTAPWQYALGLSICTFLGAGTGKVLIGWWVQKTGKQSFIVWLLAGITILSVILMAAQGAETVLHDGRSSFEFRSYCHGTRSDVSPQQQIQDVPMDLPHEKAQALFVHVRNVLGRSHSSP